MLTSRSWHAALALVTALSFGLYPVGARAEPEQCTAGPGHEALLAWVGDWQVVDETGGVLGASTVREILAGCALEEVLRRADGSEEVGLTFFDRATESWRQRWVSSRGQTGLFDLTFEQGGIAIVGSVHSAESGETLIRAFTAPRPSGGFAEQLKISVDGGTIYSAAGGTLYLPLDQQASAVQNPPPAPEEPTTLEEPPAPEETPALEATPAPELTPPAPTDPTPSTTERASKIKVRSKRKTEVIPETAMESPMTLEFELGPLTDLPPGGSWRTAELAPYVADRVNIQHVTARIRERKGKSELELVVNLRTRAGQSRVDLDVTLLSDETNVASARQEGITLGKLITSHDPEDGKPQTVRLAVDPETLAAIFADGKRPSVRLTVTVRQKT